MTLNKPVILIKKIYYKLLSCPPLEFAGDLPEEFSGKFERTLIFET
jgi:hypothetical protein